ncbi:MAG: hypothetical protein Q8934_23030 [Bacillota bacterium]|nr:hypothetical protein [Bacillota bacterium]
MIKATFTDGAALYIVVPSQGEGHGNVIVKIKKEGNGFVITHSCSENQMDAHASCDHKLYSLVLLKKHLDNYPVEFIHYENSRIHLQPDWIQIQNIKVAEC